MNLHLCSTCRGKADYLDSQHPYSTVYNSCSRCLESSKFHKEVITVDGEEVLIYGKNSSVINKVKELLE